jgi:hypothetical protein
MGGSHRRNDYAKAGCDAWRFTQASSVSNGCDILKHEFKFDFTKVPSISHGCDVLK